MCTADRILAGLQRFIPPVAQIQYIRVRTYIQGLSIIFYTWHSNGMSGQNPEFEFLGCVLIELLLMTGFIGMLEAAEPNG